MQPSVTKRSNRGSVPGQRFKSIGVIGCLIFSSAFSVEAQSKARTKYRFNATPLLQATAGKTAQSEVVELKEGSPIEREISAGAKHTYLITLKANQYLNVVVEQFGVNVEVNLFDLKKEKIATLDWWWREGTESLWALVETTGAYELEISASSRPAEMGRYRVRVEKLADWQQASAADRNFVTAHRKFAEATKLVAESTADSLRKAGEKFQEALTLWRSLKDSVSEAQTLNELAGVEYKAGNLKQAIDHLSQSIPLFRTAGNRRGEVSSLNDLGAMNNLSGETKKALEIYNQALPLARAIKDPVTESNILLGIGSMLYRLGQATEALQKLNEAVQLSEANEFIDGQAAGHNNIGAIFASQGRLREAIQHYNQTLSLLEKSNDRFGQASTLSNIGTAYSRMGDFQQALRISLQALALRRLTGDRRGEAIDLGNIGFLFLRLEDYEKARQYCDQSLTLSRTIGNRVVEAPVLGNLAIIYGMTGEWQKALDYYNQALDLRRQSGDRNSEAYVLQNLGALHDRMGDAQKALDYYDKALKIRQEVGDQYGESYTLSYLGAAYAQIGNKEKALEYANKALSLARSIGDRPGEAATLYQLAKLERDRSNIKQARSYIETALDIIETTRTKISLVDVRAIYFASRQNSYDFYIDLLMELYKSEKDQKYLDDALRANERRRARSLLDSLTEARADIRAGSSSELLEHERLMQQDLNAKADQQVRLLSRKHSSEQGAVLANEIETLSRDYEQVLMQIRQSSPRYAALTQPAPLDLKQIQTEVLDSNTVLLEYSLGEERSYLWTATPTSISSFELPKRAEIEAAARRVYDLLVAKGDALYPDALTDLSKMLLKPAADQLEGKRLVIVSEGALQYVPFAALPAPSKDGSFSFHEPLIVNHEIVSLPSASVLAVLRRELSDHKSPPKTVAVLADPVFDKDDQRVQPVIKGQQAPGRSGTEKDAHHAVPPSDVQRSISESGLNSFDRLALSRREAEVITALAPKGQTFKALDFAASRATATSNELSQYRIVHFATHSLLNNQHPELSGIVLSLVDEQGQPQDGFLRLHEIYTLKLQANLVVLSACDTALGKEIKGEGLVGLTRGFMYAGVPRVVASLWRVSDKATAELMKRFYQKMLIEGLRPAAALRAAQVSMLKEKQWVAPYYWAGFVIQGEWK